MISYQLLYNKLRYFLGQGKKICAFIITYNEASTIRYTIKHYRKYCTHIYIYDNYSTDHTREICESMGCAVNFFGTEGVLDDRAYLEVKNNVWKNHRDADYVIVCDADEIITIPSTLSMHYYKSIGYDMFSETMPRHSWEEVVKGSPNDLYNKVVLFDPKVIQEINYDFGCHSINPVFSSTYKVIHEDSSSVKLFHMRYIGGVERLIDRYKVYAERMCNYNKDHRLGFQYNMAIEEIRTTYNIKKDSSVFLQR